MDILKRSKNKKDLVGRVVTLTLLFLVLVFAVIYLISLNLSLGWFADNNGVTATGLQIAARGDQFDILVNRTAEYDTLIAGLPKYEEVPNFKNQLATEENYSFTQNSTATADGLAYEIVNEVFYNDGGTLYNFLMPGSHGTMTFYIKPKVAGAIVANIGLTVNSYKKRFDGVNYTYTKSTDPTVLNLLKGHMLLFTQRTGANAENYKYDGLITDGTITYDTSQHALCTEPGKTDCYKLVVYWEWPSYYSSIINNISVDGQPAKKYPAELGTYISDNLDYFLASNLNSSSIDELDDGYNDGDQIIGEHADFMAVSITVN